MAKESSITSNVENTLMTSASLKLSNSKNSSADDDRAIMNSPTVSHTPLS
eukprot:CAMPEP_0194382546 /NCGR_PEP_ID=MMETSP0174-20130528/61381_1 /TAXON_ID=216777 /ORGANISM="Proboscia alata, Strain PI-D3" /LENGTH=49 /DNA_ID= /DNA_START= /DNA_END= /DNA_ORIENTATION=